MEHLAALLAEELQLEIERQIDAGAENVAALLRFSPPTMNALATYIDLVLAWTKHVDLVSADKPEELIEEHILDCLVARAILKTEAAANDSAGVLDVGSGGGLPGLVWACCEPERKYVLCEPRERRSVFLKEARAAIGLANLEVVTSRLEQVSADVLPQIGVSVTRALGLKEIFLDHASRIVTAGGLVGFLTGPSFRLPALGSYSNLKFQKEIDYLVGTAKKPRKLVLLNVSRGTL